MCLIRSSIPSPSHPLPSLLCPAHYCSQFHQPLQVGACVKCAPPTEHAQSQVVSSSPAPKQTSVGGGGGGGGVSGLQEGADSAGRGRRGGEAGKGRWGGGGTELKM